MTIHRRSGGTWTNPDVIGADLSPAVQALLAAVDTDKVKSVVSAVETASQNIAAVSGSFDGVVDSARQTLDAAVLRTGLVDEHHATVEIALLAGEALIDLV